MARIRPVLWNENDAHYSTFYYDGTIVYDANDIATDNHSGQVGKAVAVVGDSEVGLGAAGGIFRGKVVVVEEDGVCTVQDGGVVEVPYLAATPPIVGRGVTVDGAGNVTSASAGATAAETALAAQVLSLDSVNLLAKVMIPH